MPPKIPGYQIPGLPPAGQAVIFRNWKQIEAFPVTAFAQSTAVTTLTTVFVAIPGMRVSVVIPGNAVVYADVATDLQSETAADAAEAHLFVAQPTPGTTVLTDFSTTFCILTPSVVATETVRATVAAMWRFLNPIPGLWTFEVRARKFVNAGTARENQNSSLRILSL